MPDTATTTATILKGRLAHIYAERETWFAGRIELSNRRHANVAGRCPAVPPIHADLTLHGEWTTHDKFGRQFAFTRCDVELPTTERGILRFLETLPGIGPVRAQQIYDLYGADSLRILQEDPDALHFIRGMGKQAEAAIAAIAARQADINVEQRLCAYGFGDRTREKIRERFGPQLPAVLDANPYRLVEVDRVSFHQVDNACMTVAQFPPESPFRAAAATLQALKNASQAGHTWLDRANLDRELDALRLATPIPPEARPAGETQAVDDATAIRVDADGLALQSLADDEQFVADKLRSLLAAGTAPAGNLDDVQPAVLDALTPEQRRALNNALTQRVSILTGGPGTGKTYSTRAILQALGPRNCQIVAPTGKAAKRASQMTGAEAMTIHRFAGALDFGHPEPPVILCDETSMVSIDVLAMLLRALQRDDTRLVFIGDVDQLPSVGPGQVLRDLIDSDAIPTVRLSRIQRQAEGSRIIVNAHRLNRGEPMDHAFTADEDWFYLPGDDPARLAQQILHVVRRAVDRWGYDPRSDIQVLAGQHASALGVAALNDLLRNEFNPPDGSPEILDGRGKSLFRRGDKVIITKNEYRLGVVNGDVGLVSAVRPFDPNARDDDGKFIPAAVTVSLDDARSVVFAGDDLKLVAQAWACTVHKYQGSEVPCVVMVCHSCMWWACQRPLLYTGITRASERLILAGNPKAIAQATRNNAPSIRLTRLKALLQ